MKPSSKCPSYAKAHSSPRTKQPRLAFKKASPAFLYQRTRAMLLSISSSDHRAVFDRRVLGHDDNPFAYVVAAVGGVRVLYAPLVDEAHALSDARVLVYDGAT